MPKKDRGAGPPCRHGWRRKPHQWAPRAYFQLWLKRVDRLVRCWYSPRTGYRLSSVEDLAGILLYSHPIPPWGWTVKKRVVGAAASSPDGPVHLAALESGIFSSLHPIVRHCAVVRYDTGEARTPGKLFLETLGSAWKLAATDPDTCSKLQVVSQNLDDALALLSLLLDAEDTPWEVDQYAVNRSRQKKK